MMAAQVNKRHDQFGPETGKHAFVTADDMRALVQLPLSLAIAWLAPDASLQRLAQLSAKRLRARESTWASERRIILDLLLKERVDPATLAEATAKKAVHRSLLQLHLLRCLRPDGWQPPCELVGRATLDAALGRGQGAILWLAPFVYFPLHAKVAVARAGFSVSHLSRFWHGRFTSAVGNRLLNALTRRAEDRFLAERIAIGPSLTTIAATRLLARRLHENKIVSITANRVGSEVRVPFLTGELVLANGAARLALANGAPLLPVFSVQTAEGALQTIVEAPLEADPGSGDPLRALHAAFARRIEPYAARYPDQLLVSYDSSVIVVARESVRTASPS